MIMGTKFMMGLGLTAEHRHQKMNIRKGMSPGLHRRDFVQGLDMKSTDLGRHFHVPKCLPQLQNLQKPEDSRRTKDESHASVLRALPIPKMRDTHVLLYFRGCISINLAQEYLFLILSSSNSANGRTPRMCPDVL
jgi:hypothetical protein